MVVGVPWPPSDRSLSVGGCGWVLGLGPTAFHSLVGHPALQVMELFRFCLRIPIRVSDRALCGCHRAAVVCMGYEPDPVIVGKGPEL